MILSLIIVLSFIRTAQAEVFKNTLELNGNLGAEIYLSHRDVLSNDLLIGARVGWNFDYDIGIEGSLSYVPPIKNSLNIFTVTADVLYHFFNKGVAVPFVLAGVGMASFFHKENGNNVGFIFDVGVGVKFIYFRTWGIRLDIRYAHMGPGPKGMNIQLDDLQFTIGLHFMLFASPKTTK